MSEDAPNFCIADDYDPDGDRPSADSDPMAAYLTYLEDKRLGAVGEMGSRLRISRRTSPGCGSGDSAPAPPGDMLSNIAPMGRWGPSVFASPGTEMSSP